MNDITIFNHLGNDIRVMTDEQGDPWFVASDVAKILGYRDAYNLTRRLDPDEKGTRSASTPGGIQEATTINESGLYAAILGSKVKGAREFRRWVTSEVLPSIRKHGMYATPVTIDAMIADPDMAIKLLTNLKEERAKRAKAEAEVEANAPKVLFADAVASAKTDILIGDLAKILRGNGVDTGQRRLFEWMRENGYLIRQKGSSWNMPTQKAMDMGLFKVKETVVTHADGHTTVNRTTKVTGRGQTYFVNKFLAHTAED